MTSRGSRAVELSDRPRAALLRAEHIRWANAEPNAHRGTRHCDRGMHNHMLVTDNRQQTTLHRATDNDRKHTPLQPAPAACLQLGKLRGMASHTAWYRARHGIRAERVVSHALKAYSVVNSRNLRGVDGWLDRACGGQRAARRSRPPAGEAHEDRVVVRNQPPVGEPIRQHLNRTNEGVCVPICVHSFAASFAVPSARQTRKRRISRR